ncbi:hypothetical protein GKZ89_09710 [Bacillus mangrovi]|uniref:Uncharacterized protein n=1 Tax=Metabacillus mangrovi TaxID=1491830 RepID=A0A7X2S4V7_9BACI|nr:hypothetical protein [Metabacillus mangrovi]MTH53679.1 hypothetical protein [Metabacillus mangrovi]
MKFVYKIKPETKRHKIPSHVKEHLSLPAVTPGIKVGLAVLTVIGLDFSGLILLPVFNEYTVPDLAGSWLYPIYGLLVLLNLWMLTLIFRKSEKIVLEIILFLGCLGGIAALSYFVCGLFYTFLMIRQPLLLMVLTCLFAASLYMIFRHYERKYTSLKKYETNITAKIQMSIFTVLIILWGCTAYYFGAYTKYGAAGLVLFCFGISASFQFLFVHMIHKYFFIKANRLLMD